MNTCKCGALIPNGVYWCTECRTANYAALVEPTEGKEFDADAFLQFLDEGE